MLRPSPDPAGSGRRFRRLRPRPVSLSNKPHVCGLRRSVRLPRVRQSPPCLGIPLALTDSRQIFHAGMRRPARGSRRAEQVQTLAAESGSVALNGAWHGCMRIERSGRLMRQWRAAFFDHHLAGCRTHTARAGSQRHWVVAHALAVPPCGVLNASASRRSNVVALLLRLNSIRRRRRTCGCTRVDCEEREAR